MYRFTSSSSSSNVTDKISNLIISNNIVKINNLFEIKGINDIQEDLGGFTALQYAVTLPNKEIVIQCLLKLGADPYKKINKDTHDSITISRPENIKYMIDHLRNNDKLNISRLENANLSLSDKLTTSEKEKKYLLDNTNNNKNTIDSYIAKNNNLKEDNVKLKSQITNNKRKFDQLDIEHANLELELINTNKKYETSEKAYQALERKIRKP
jgi:hypothetical protein